MTLDVDRSEYRLRAGPWAGRTLYDLYEEASTPWEWHAPLKEAAEAEGILFFSTPFDASAVAFLDGLDVPAYKVASFELVDLPLLRRIARTGKPAIVSTGLASQQEIAEAVATLAGEGCPGVALLHCTSAYPSSAAEADLVTIPFLHEEFGLPVGLSDHSLDIAVPTAAAALGATILEKHLTLRRQDGGPDAAFSLEPEEFRATVEAVRTAAAARGTVRDGPTPGEADSLVFRRSIIAARDIPAGAVIEEGWVRVLRPSIGLHPRYLDDVIGRRAAVAIRRGEGVTFEHLQPEET
jgi:N-acetylneuraminate synthase